MNALINHTAELTGMGHMGMDFPLTHLDHWMDGLAGMGHAGLPFSLPNLSQLMPGSISPWIIATIAFFLVVAIDDARFNQQPDDTKKKNR